MNLDQARFFMVEQQIRPWDVLDPIILDLLMNTPRHEFVSESQIPLAYSDIELPIGHDETMMSPKVEGRLLQALDIEPQDRILEIGTGSGYMTALLASLGESVTTVELHSDLQATAKSRLEKFGNIEFHIGDGSQNWDDEQQYDVILLTGSVSSIPEAYKQKLTQGGRMAAICGQSPAMTAQVITRIADHEWATETLFETELKALTHAESKEIFEF
ncbi:protein-L-isoaspartate O-methyltransferase [Thiomicrorhabdus sp.]|uniref:protein-L-isoaspartate O-methyltransferase family protein n=1 Tax=Thiomicrorhabdus sp. TaxID=2039724 RepID=UPI0029C735AB|nr:protein-L-isoaspartate O-methyltransferase [Thiomicrorhabdus sp.]